MQSDVSATEIAGTEIAGSGIIGEPDAPRATVPDPARARRRAALARAAEHWAKPIEGVRHRLSAWTNMLLVDHGIFRLLYCNRHRVDDGLWRSAQPAPHDIRWAARRGIRTVVTLRGGRSFGSWPLEREACERAGIALVELPLYSRAVPTREAIHAVDRALKSIAYPALMHCKSGADRAGIAAALYLILVRGASAAEAAAQLHLRYGHVKSAKTGILDAFLDRYREDGEAAGLSFLEWVDTRYDPDAITASYRSTLWTDLLLDRVLRRE
jgi:protein tyrosine/serine phosphatase